MKKAKARNLICRSCKGVYYKTTEMFTPHKAIAANMFEMIEPYKSQNWRQFPKDPDGINGYGNLLCPNCDSEYANMYGFAFVEGLPDRNYPLTGEEIAAVEAERAEREKPLEVREVRKFTVWRCERCLKLFHEESDALDCLKACKEYENGLKAGQ